MGHPERGTESQWPKMAIGEAIHAEFVPGLNKVRVTSDFFEDKLDPEIIRRLDRREPVEVSVGFRAALVPEDGTWRGEMYHAKETELEFTHFAIVPAGACGWKDGCGLGLHGTDNLDELTDDQLTDYFDHQVSRLAELQEAGCDQTARYHCRYDLATAIDSSRRRDTNPLQNVLNLGSEGRDERTLLAIQEAQAWFGKFYGDHTLESNENGGGEIMAEKGEKGEKGEKTGGDETNAIIDISTPAQLEALLNQVTTIDDVGAKADLATKVLEKVLENAKSGKGMFAKPKEEGGEKKTEGQHSAGGDGEQEPVVKKVYLRPVVTVEAGHDDEPGDVATVTFEETESEDEAKRAVEGLVKERNALSKESAESKATVDGIKNKLKEAEDAKTEAETKIRDALMERLKALPGMDDEAIKAYEDMDNAALEKFIFGLELVHSASVGEGGVVDSSHSADGGKQKTPMKVPGVQTKGGYGKADWEADMKAYREIAGRV